MIAEVYYKTSNNPEHLNFAKGQIDYMLGSNPMNMSYEVGFVDKYPQFPHHRAASGWTQLETDGEPDQNDNYTDNIEDYQHTEVAIDYNSGFVGALAGMTKYYGQNQTPEKMSDLKL
jgi:hypothetical protein